MTRIARLLAAPLLAFALIGGGAAPAAALQPYVFVLQWGSTGSANGQFQDPSDVAVDTAGMVYVTDKTTGRIQKFDANGGFIKSWNKACKFFCPTFDGPEGIAAGNGVVWLADSGNSRLVKMDTNGAQLLEVPTPAPGQPGAFGSPYDLDVDRVGNVYVISTPVSSSTVQVFSAQGAYVRTMAVSGAFAVGGVTVANDFSVYALYTTGVDLHIAKFDRFGNPAGTFGILGGPGNAGISVDAFNRLYVSNGSGTINVYSVTGSLLGQFGTFGSGTLQFNNPEVAAPNAVGILYVADRGNDRVQKVTETSTLTVVVAGLAPDITPGPAFSATGPTPIGTFTLDQDPATPAPDQLATANLVPGSYTVNASPSVAGFTLQNIHCTNGASAGFAPSFQLTIQAGASITCTYYYEWIG